MQKCRLVFQKCRIIGSHVRHDLTWTIKRRVAIVMLAVRFWRLMSVLGDTDWSGLVRRTRCCVYNTWIMRRNCIQTRRTRASGSRLFMQIRILMIRVQGYHTEPYGDQKRHPERHKNELKFCLHYSYYLTYSYICHYLFAFTRYTHTQAL